jgi:hypothetical protein
MKANVDYVLFAVRDYFKDKATFNNGELQLDPSFEPTQHVMISGQVVQIPVRLSSKPIMVVKEHTGFPAYGPAQGFPNDYVENNLHSIYSTPRPHIHRMHDIVAEVLPGDTIYFHYNTLMRKDNFVADNLIDADGNEFDLWKVRYDQIICAVRPRAKKKQGKQFVMIGGWCLVEPDMETWDDILRPTYYQDITDPVTGKPMVRPKNEWLQIKKAPEQEYLRGYLKHVGTPLKGKETQLKSGDYIVYTPDADFEVEIEGRTYFAIRQNHIEGVIEVDKTPALTLSQ